MSLHPGTTLGPYTVTAKIGEGGMGEVYQARDTKLDRDVALKVLPEAFTSDPDRLARFEREAKVLASLNHPNIGAIYGLEEAEGVKALVLELIEGPTLADRIAHGPIPIDEALPIAKQIAEALEAAHEQGVIHRDLKPANVKVREDGTVKVLDFGLAKAFQPDGSDPNMSASPTISLTAAATQMGMVIGTAAYMSPEQARGQVVDRRADVWAFGAVLFEMLSGRRVFDGRDVSETLAGVIKSEAPWEALPSDTPPTLSTVLRRCLEKEPKHRIRDIGDVSLAMEGAFETKGAVAAGARVSHQSQRWQALAVGFVLAIITGLAVWSVMRPEPLQLVRFAVSPYDRLAIAAASVDVAISPDGRHVAYVTGVSRQGGPLQLRSLDRLESTILVADGPNLSPFFSPDSEEVGYYVNEPSPVLKRVPVGGGPASIISDLPGNLRGASWGADGTIVFAANARLWRVPATGGAPESLTVPDPGGAEFHLWPEILPGGEAVLFTIARNSVTDSQVAVLSLDTGEQKVVVRGGSNPRYSPTGHVVYGLNGTLWAVPFDLEGLEAVGGAIAVQDDVLTKDSGAAAFGISDNGRLVFVVGEGRVGAQNSLVWVDREGHEEPLALPPHEYGWPRVSPDGTRLAVSVMDPGNRDVWVSDLARGTLTNVTTDPAPDNFPVWTPDGEGVVFTSQRDNGPPAFFWKQADGTGPVEQLVMDDETLFREPWDWSTDGNTLVFGYSGDGTRAGIGVLALDGDRAWESLILTNGRVVHPAISPNGDWIAFASDQTGRFEVFVQRFPDLGGQHPISTGGGAAPVWSPDGRELFYRRQDDGAMMVVTIDADPVFTPGSPRVLFEGRYVLGGPWRHYDVAPDGQRFVMIKDATRDGPGPALVAVLNWFEELERIVPPN